MKEEWAKVARKVLTSNTFQLGVATAVVYGLSVYAGRLLSEQMLGDQEVLVRSEPSPRASDSEDAPVPAAFVDLASTANNEGAELSELNGRGLVLLENSLPMRLQRFQIDAVRGWTVEDPERTAEWLFANACRECERGLYISFMEGIVVQGLATGVVTLEAQPEEVSSHSTVDTLVQSLQGDLKFCSNWIEQIECGRLRSHVARRVASSLLDRSLPEAETWLFQLKQPSIQKEVCEVLAEGLTRRSQEGASTWVSQLPRPLIVDGIEGMVREMSRYDVSSTAGWLERYDCDAKVKKCAFEELVRSGFQQDPGEALGVALQHLDRVSSLRFSSLYFLRWLRRDEEAARNWLEERDRKGVAVGYLRQLLP